MEGRTREDAKQAGGRLLFLVFLFVFFLVFLFVQILRNDIEVDGMGLRNFELRLALGTAQNLALFHFVFVHVDFGGTFGTADHVCIPPYS